MVDEAISIQPQDAAALAEVRRLLEHGSAALTGPAGERATLPLPLFELLKDIVRGLEDGRSMVVLREDEQLTTQRAAELLGMPHHYMIRELDDEIIPSHLIGKERRVTLRDVVAYAKRQAEVRASLTRIARDAFEDGLYDNHIGLLEGQSDK